MKFDVVGIETPCVDLAVNVMHFPEANGGARVLENSWQGGGKVATGMVAASRLGARGAVIGSVGDDVYGEFCIADFNRHGIDTAGLIKRPGRNTLFDVVVSNKADMGRCILWYPGEEPNRFLTVEELPEGYLENTRYLYIATVNETTLEAMRRAKRTGAEVVMDADGYARGDEQAFGLVDIFIGSEYYYKALFGEGADREESCRKMQAAGPHTVIFTMGSEGCFGLSEEGFFTLPSCQVEVVDTVGAGDVFHGAYIAGVLRGYGAQEAARFASAAAGIKCTRIGGRAGIPDVETVLSYMETGQIDYKEIDERVRMYRQCPV